MVVSETVEHSIRLRGPCSSWLPVVQGSLAERGYRCISIDESARTLTAVHGDVPVSGSISVTLTPTPDGDTDISVSVTTTLGSTSKPEV